MQKKSSKTKFNKYISIILAIVIIVAIGIYAYTTFVKKEPISHNNQPPNIQPQETLLTITIGTQSYNYTFQNLTALDNITGQGSYINKVGKITGPYNYTGIPIDVLLRSIPALPINYALHAIASDNYTHNYSINEVNGHVMVFNDTGSEIGVGNLTMIIAYKQNGVFLNETTKGPLRIAFIETQDTQPSITNSGLWLSSLIKIEII